MERLAVAVGSNSSLRQLNVGGNPPQYDARLWLRALRTNFCLSQLNLPYCAMMPTASHDFLAAQIASSDIVLRVEMRVALCMGLHPRLGARSLLHSVSDHVLSDIFRFTWAARQITVEAKDLHFQNNTHA